MFKSQDKQDYILYHHVFKSFENGIFVDVGAHDGIKFNNTYYFENNHNWTGINIEPMNNIYNLLVQNRPKCINLNCAVSNYNGIGKFKHISGISDMLSGLEESYHPKHKARINDEIRKHNQVSSTIEIPVKTLDIILKTNNINKINYLSIDVEGGELNVLKSINYDDVFIDVIGFECNYRELLPEIINFLESKNFKRIFNNKSSLDIFMINNNSKFLKNL